MIDYEDIPQNVCEGEPIVVDGQRGTVVRDIEKRRYYDYHSTEANKGKRLVVNLGGYSAPGGVSHAINIKRYDDRDEAVVKKHEYDSGGGFMPKSTWTNETEVEEIHFPWRGQTKPLLYVSEGDRIRFNGRSKAVEVVSVHDGNDAFSARVEGDWDGAATYKLTRYWDDTSSRKIDEPARVERYKRSSAGGKRFLKDANLRSVTIVD